ncbi:MAG: phage tail protein, partial [Desulfovibrio sp.]|nr:phage tail protein [Desulfovibrio sp.]
MSDQLTATVPASVPTTPGIEGSVPSTEAPQFYCMLTNAGAALEAQAHALGKPVRLSHVAVGDGGGTVPTPSVEAVALLGETYRKAIDSITRDEADPNIAWIQIVIPADVGGFWIREFGVWAEPLEEGGEPVLYAYGNHA